MNSVPGKMNAEIKAKWLEALRSDRYTQGTGVLRSADDKFCCLGVLCDLAEREGVVTAGRDQDLIDEFPNMDISWNYNGDDAELPTAVLTWAGLESRNPLLLSGSAIELNDEEQYTFDQIADEIEEAL